VVGTTIVSRIPGAGTLALMVMAVFGSGAAALAFAEWRRTRKLAATPAPAGAPIATFPGAAAMTAPAAAESATAVLEPPAEVGEPATAVLEPPADVGEPATAVTEPPAAEGPPAEAEPAEAASEPPAAEGPPAEK